MKWCMGIALISGLLVVMNVVVYAQSCYIIYEVDCPPGQAYCSLRNEATCTNPAQGFHNYKGPFGTYWDPEGSVVGQGNQVPCYAPCTCVWDNELNQCYCDDQSIGAPTGHPSTVCWVLCAQG